MKTYLSFLLKKHGLSIAMLTGAFAAIALAGFTTFAADCERLPEKVLRLHIIANSDSEEDQLFKYQLRDHILREYSPMLGGCDSLPEAKCVSEQLLPKIELAALSFADENDYKTEIKTELTEMYFTTRVYEGFTLPAGNYTALRVTIGEGAGKNWWCVMFPPLCVPAVTDDSEFSKNAAIDAIHIPETGGDGTKIKFAVFEFLSGLFK
ncbi:MAG: stage II sporulation protein R [Oscillospiraceae bacterium]|nr:stage II sporulation protein R [Oscillospiraceae bacterium]